MGTARCRPIRAGRDPLVGYGHYHETYENIAGQLFIKSSKLTRLREDIVTPVCSIYVSNRIRSAMAKLEARFVTKP